MNKVFINQQLLFEEKDVIPSVPEQFSPSTLRVSQVEGNAFEANQFRLFLHSAAYVLTHAFRAHALKHSEWATATMETIRLKFFKIGACVSELKTKVKVALPTSYPLKRILIRSFQLFENLAPT